MTTNYLLILALVLITIGFFGYFSLVTQAVDISTGDLIKSASNSAVYYYGSDGNRYCFPNENTYKTWYADFSSVKTISDAELAAIPLKGNVTYKPGVKMVKIQTDPKVYVVDKGATLRGVTSEGVAAVLYGSSWSTKIDDISVAFFINYKMGSDVNSNSDFDKSAAESAATSIDVDKGIATNNSDNNNTTDNLTTLSAPSLTAPSSVTAAASFTLNWSTVANALTYALEKSAGAAFLTPATFYSGANTSVTDAITTAYYYRVKAQKNAVSSAWSNVVKVEIGCAVLSAPTLTISSNTANSGINYSLSWTNLAGAVNYTLQRATNASFTNTTDVGLTAQTAITATENQTVANNTTYYYRVKATNSCGDSAWSNTVSIQVAKVCVAPATPVLADPGNTIDLNTPLALQWNAVAGATDYMWAYDTDSSFSHPSTAGVGAANSVNLNTNAAGTYYYRVLAANSCGQSTWSNVVDLVIKPAPSLCTDGTLFGQCSITKPLQCSNGLLINNCQTCGCPSGQTCQLNGNCILSSPAYYISNTGDDINNDGKSESKPWRTISKVNGYTGFKPGDNILFKKGDTWYEQLIIPASGTSGNPIKLGAYGSGANPVIDGQGIRNYAIQIQGKSYVIIDGINTINAADRNIDMWNVNNLIIRNLNVSNDIVISPNNRGGIWLGGNTASNNLIENVKTYSNGHPKSGATGGTAAGNGIMLYNNAHDNIIQNCISYDNAEDGIQIGDSGTTATNNIVQDCETYNNHESGIDIKNGPQVLRRNKIHNNDGANGEGTGIVVSQETNALTITENEIYSNANHGIQILDTTGSNQIVSYNKIHDNGNINGGYGVSSYETVSINYNSIYDNYWGGIRLSNTAVNSKVYNNLMWGNNVYYKLYVDAPGTTIKNNILDNQPDTLRITVNAQTGLTSNNNLFDTGSNLIWGSTYYSLSNWKTATGQDANSIEAIPLFMNEAGKNFHLQSSSPAINKGVDVGLTRDIENNPIQGLPDIGAYEFH